MSSNNITGTYNLATSMEGWIGEVNIDGSNQVADIYLDINNDGDYEDLEEQLLNLPYSFNDTFNAIELIESNEFKHYGVYIDNDFAVWDSYFWNESEWQGDGMAVMVRQPDTVNLLDFIGQYTFIDVDGDSGTYQLIDVSDSETKLELNVVGEDHDKIIITDDNVRSTGIIDFSADFVEPFDSSEDWHIMVLPGKAMIIASSDKDENVFAGDGGIAVAIKEQ